MTLTRDINHCSTCPPPETTDYSRVLDSIRGRLRASPTQTEPRMSTSTPQLSCNQIPGQAYPARRTSTISILHQRRRALQDSRPKREIPTLFPSISRIPAITRCKVTTQSNKETLHLTTQSPSSLTQPSSSHFQATSSMLETARSASL